MAGTKLKTIGLDDLSEEIEQGRELCTMLLSDLKLCAAAYNPRQISDKDLAALALSMDTFGVVEPIVLNVRSRLIVGGHQRVRAAEVAELSTLPVWRVSLSTADERRLNLALNKISGGWDDELLRQMLLELTDVDMNPTGFSASEIVELLGAIDEDGAGLPDELAGDDAMSSVSFSLTPEQSEELECALVRARAHAEENKGNKNALALMRVVAVYLGSAADA